MSMRLAPMLRLLSACVGRHPASQMRQALNGWAWQAAEKDMPALELVQPGKASWRREEQSWSLEDEGT